MGFFASAADERQKIEQIMNRFPGPVTLYPSQARNALMVFGNLVLVALGIWMIRTSYGDWATFRAWAITIFFGLCLMVFCMRLLLPRLSSLTLERDGFTNVVFHRRLVHSWRDVTGFQAWQVKMTQMVLFDDRSKPSRGLNKLLSLNSSLSDTYGFKAETLIELMKRWQEKAVQRQ